MPTQEEINDMLLALHTRAQNATGEEKEDAEIALAALAWGYGGEPISPTQVLNVRHGVPLE